MNDVLATTLTYVSLAAALWALVLAIAGQPTRPDRWYGVGVLGVVALLELGLVVQAVGGIVALFVTERELDGFSFVGYLVGPVLVLALAAFWALAEKTRWGPAVLVVGCLAVPVMLLRLQQVWDAHA
ncbi:hypothetical protein BLA60_11470 [Actinophytocola xinjiangensis]|uniref:Uncharacterized protein n=1 Tax=Actinophytocola xinjiangensis TaxID=485602 RepID=A0A7Z1AZ92_9PSEU|nr:hypothetical protein [Actinophytocola xinjiangensis]OLF11567.1 hypothetical protein BLA60_11470 [Actinophytocola xinjiangensis]